jgi:hypothetical protein
VRVKIARPHSTMRLCALITSGGTFQSVTQEDPVDTPLEEPLIYFRSSRSIHSPPSTRIDRLTSDPLLLSQHTVLKDFEAQDSRARGTYATFLPRQNPTTLAISSVVPTYSATAYSSSAYPQPPWIYYPASPTPPAQGSPH